MSCYYLIASLPSLKLTQPPPMTPEAFKALFISQLNERDGKALERLCNGPDYGDGRTAAAHPFVAAWQSREIQLRNAVARSRAERRKTDAAGSLRPHTGFDTFIEDAVEDAFDLPDPLTREQALDRLRWKILDELAGFDPFATPVVLAYVVKLRIAQRWSALNTDKALKRVDAALSAPAGNSPLDASLK
jgi:hypothetical protein